MEKLEKVIDVRNMHTAIHSLYKVTGDEKIVLQCFQDLEFDNDGKLPEEYIWNELYQHVEYIGEIHYMWISGGSTTRLGIPTDDCVYADGDNEYQVIGRFDIY